MEIKTLTTKDDIVKIITDLMDNGCKVITEAKKLRLSFIDKDEKVCYSVRLGTLRTQPEVFRKRINDSYGIMIGNF